MYKTEQNPRVAEEHFNHRPNASGTGDSTISHTRGYSYNKGIQKKAKQ